MTCTCAYDVSTIDEFEQEIELHPDHQLLDELSSELLRIRAALPAAQWREFCLGPFRRQISPSLENPRHNTLLQAWERTLPGNQGRLNAHNLFASEIREEVRATPRARILSLGDPVLTRSDFSQFDHPSFACDASFAETRERLLSSPASERFDLIYCAEWLNQCSDRQASSWLMDAAGLLRRTGRLVAANLTPGGTDAAYLEARNLYWPVYRDEEDLANLASGLFDQDLRGHAVYRDNSGTNNFLEIYAA